MMKKTMKVLTVISIFAASFLLTKISTAATWYTQTVDSNGDVGSFSAIAIDSGGNPHFSYLDYSNGNLKYGYWDGSAWQTQTAESSSNYVGLYTSITLDSSNNPHISHYEQQANYDLKYAYYDGTSWQNQTIDSTGQVGGRWTPKFGQPE
jgi:hypothetical protein